MQSFVEYCYHYFYCNYLVRRKCKDLLGYVEANRGNKWSQIKSRALKQYQVSLAPSIYPMN